MKNRYFLKKSIVGLLPLTLSMAVLFGVNTTNTQEVDAYSNTSLTTTIDLNECKDNEIRSYYSGLNSLSVSERSGTNLLKNLKTILSNGQKYYKYDDTDYHWKMYEITDRDWTLSPASKITGYNSTDNKIYKYTYKASTGTDAKNPYVHALYVDRNVSNPMRAWGNHTQNEGGINREHIWAKSHGFDDEDGAAAGARGDPMHLWPSDGHTNNIHNNNFFGNVDKSKSYTDTHNKFSYNGHNLLGTSKTIGSGTVFEPQDCDKGDIARACFYMVARYNNYEGNATDIDVNNPNLCLSDNINNAVGTSTASKPYDMGVLTDLLEWNRLDPPDEFEIKRNDLVFKNYTNNRNPFIDFPYWAEIAFGKAGSSANPSKDEIHATEAAELTSIAITTQPTKKNYKEGEKFDPTGMVVTGTYSNGETAPITDYSYTPNGALKITDTIINISYLNKTTSLSINVVPLASIAVTNPPTKTTYKVGEMFDPTGMVITATYSDSSLKVIPSDEYTYTTKSLTESDTTVTISYLGKTTTVNITVESDIVLTGISVVKGPDKTDYQEGEMFDPTGMVINGNYSDGSQQIILNYLYSSEPLEAGEQTIIITFGDFTATTIVKVKALNRTEKTISFVMSEENLANKEVVKEINGEDEFHVNFYQGSSQHNPTYYDSTKAISIYAGNDFTISGRYKIISIQLIVSSSIDSNNNYETNPKDTYDSNAYLWSGRADDVTFSLLGDNGVSKLSRIDITYDTAEEAVIEEYTILDWVVEHWYIIAIVAGVIVIVVIISAASKGKKKGKKHGKR